MRPLAITALTLLFGPPLAAASLDIAQVQFPQVNCVFDADCTITVADTSDHFTIGPTSGDAFLQSRTFPPGEPGTAGAGLTAYLYRIDLRQLVGITAAPCVNRLSLDFGTVAKLDYDADGTADDLFVATGGGLGTVEVSSAEQTGGRIDFYFSPPVCAGSSPGNGDSSFFFGAASSRTPRHLTAEIASSIGGTLSLDARAPKLGFFAVDYWPWVVLVIVLLLIATLAAARRRRSRR